MELDSSAALDCSAPRHCACAEADPTPGIPRGLQMRRRPAAAAPGEARPERCFGRGSALTELANGDAPPVSTDTLPPISDPAPTRIPMALALGFPVSRCYRAPAVLWCQAASLICSCPPELQLSVCVSHTPCSLALKSSQACDTSSGVQMRNRYSRFIMQSLWLAVTTQTCDCPASGLPGVSQFAALLGEYR